MKLPRIVSQVVAILLLLATTAFAGDSDPKPLPPDAQRVSDELDKEIARAKEKAVADLKRMAEREAKAGHPDVADAINAKIASLKGEQPAAAPAPRPGTPDALIAVIKNGTIDEGTWKGLNAPEITCKAADLTDLKVTLTANQRAIVVPCPSDSWQSDPGSGKVGYQGENFKQGNWPRESMVVRIGESAETTKRVADDPVCIGPGKLYVAAYDTGSASRVGAIRVKVVLLR